MGFKDAFVGWFTNGKHLRNLYKLHFNVLMQSSLHKKTSSRLFILKKFI